MFDILSAINCTKFHLSNTIIGRTGIMTRLIISQLTYNVQCVSAKKQQQNIIKVTSMIMVLERRKMAPTMVESMVNTTVLDHPVHISVEISICNTLSLPVDVQSTDELSVTNILYVGRPLKCLLCEHLSVYT